MGELASMNVVSLTVIPDVHTLQGVTARGGQQYGSANVISVQIAGRTPAAAKTRRRSHVIPLASGRGMIELPGAVSPPGQIGQGTLVGALVVFVVFVTGSLYMCREVRRGTAKRDVMIRNDVLIHRADGARKIQMYNIGVLTILCVDCRPEK